MPSSNYAKNVVNSIHSHKKWKRKNPRPWHFQICSWCTAIDQQMEADAHIHNKKGSLFIKFDFFDIFFPKILSNAHFAKLSSSFAFTYYWGSSKCIIIKEICHKKIRDFYKKNYIKSILIRKLHISKWSTNPHRCNILFTCAIHMSTYNDIGHVQVIRKYT